MDLESVSKLKPKKGLFILIGIILLGIIFIASSFTSISGGNVGVVFVKIGKTPSDPSRIVVEKGEEGWQREVLMPGFKYVGLFARLWKINIYEEPMFTIKPGQVGTIEAFDGLPLRPGQILADDDEFDKDGKFIKMGQKGPRKTVLTPGTHPINPKYMKVDRQPAKFIKDGQIGIVTKLVGDMPPAGTILVSKEDNFRGIQKEILQPGEYYLNPKAVDIKIIDAIVIKKGQVGVVTKKIGDEPPYGTILVARESNFRGIQREILQPGMYYEYAHPYRYDVKIVPAINVPDGHIGVQIAKTGETKPFDQLLANAGQRGIRKDSLSPGLYYVNPFEFEIVVVDVRQQRYEMTLQADQGDTQGSDSITFLSDDGFEIEIDLTVLWQILPQDSPYVVATVGRDVKDVQDKIIRPSARSFARILGSTNKGEEFVHGKTREVFQTTLNDKLTLKCALSKIQVNATLIRHFDVPQTLRDPITQKVIAQKLEEKYLQQQKTQIANAELERQKQLVDFQSRKVKAEALKMEAQLKAEQNRDVAKIAMAEKEFNAKGDAEKVKIDAEAQLFAAQREAEGIKAKILAEKLSQAEGQKALVDAWSGDGAKYVVAYEAAKRLEGVSILPLDDFFGGGSGTTTNSNGDVIRYQDNVEMLKFFKILDTNEKVKEAQK